MTSASSSTRTPPTAADEAEPEPDEAGAAAESTVGSEEASEPGAPSGPAGPSGGGAARIPRGGRWREPRLWVPAAVAVVALSAGAGLAFAARDSGPEVEPLPPLPVQGDVDAGGLEVPVPQGWFAAPVPNLGFGVALPNGWEAVVLADEVLDGIESSTPAVPGFLESAHAAQQSGAIFYAAGADEEERVTDLKVRAAPNTGVEDTAGLADYARALAADAGLADPQVEELDAARPTVRTRFTVRATDDAGATVDITGTETLVLGPRGVVWSLIVTSEDPDAVDDLGPRIVDTLTLADAPPEAADTTGTTAATGTTGTTAG